MKTFSDILNEEKQQLTESVKVPSNCIDISEIVQKSKNMNKTITFKFVVQKDGHAMSYVGDNGSQYFSKPNEKILDFYERALATIKDDYK